MTDLPYFKLLHTQAKAKVPQTKLLWLCVLSLLPFEMVASKKRTRAATTRNQSIFKWLWCIETVTKGESVFTGWGRCDTENTSRYNQKWKPFRLCAMLEWLLCYNNWQHRATNWVSTEKITHCYFLKFRIHFHASSNFLINIFHKEDADLPQSSHFGSKIWQLA